VSEEARISSVIFDYAGKIGRATDTDSTLHLNAALARDLVGADRCSIWLIDSRANQLWTKVAHGVDELRIPIGEGVIGACVAENRPIVVNHAARDPRFHGKVDEKTGYETRSLLAIPLSGSSGNVIGALQVLNKPGGFHAQDVNLLGLAAAYSASAIEAQWLRQQMEASRILQRELEIARGVQERLFPQQLPVCRGLDLAAVCRPARAVGGDYFDFISVPGGALLFTLGDVSGKGIAAAVLMASIQASIRSQVLRPPESLAALVGDFNRAVFSLSTLDKYSTLFCGLLNPETRQLTYVNAAQVPPVVVRATGEIERLETGGTAVGMFPASRYRQATVILEPGDAVVCFSDGISEAANVHDEMWDEAQYLALLQRGAHLDARGIVDALVAGADAFAGEAEQADDMTVVVLKAASVAEKA
jgi:phosphoserine phosphatase RsbU/P